MAISWKEAVISALERYSARHSSVMVERSPFIAQELAEIVKATGSIGNTPDQTVSRVLQELRDEQYLYFSSSGRYVLNKKEIDVESEDLPEDVLENAALTGNLNLKDLTVSDEVGTARLRKGVYALRAATLRNYNFQCALCDIDDKQLLVTSHIARWADQPNARGKLSNTICYCKAHDALFEHGYFGLSDDLTLLVKPSIRSAAIRTWLSSCTGEFRLPSLRPATPYLVEHRRRVGL